MNTAELASYRTKAAEKNRRAGLRKTKKAVQPTIQHSLQRNYHF